MVKDEISRGRDRYITFMQGSLREDSGEVCDTLGHADGDGPAGAVANDFHTEKVGGIHVGFSSLGEFTEGGDER
jgi:hypothetical protein